MRLETVRISLFSLMDGASILAGLPRGEVAFARLVSVASPVSSPTRILLDFQMVEVATASFLRESVLRFRTFCRGVKGNLYPVVANANSVVVDELVALLDAKADAIVLCNVTEAGVVSSARLVGTLEEKQSITLAAVTKEREADAVGLSRTYGDAKPTAWNNRLVSLSSKGILVESRRGSVKYYAPVLEGLAYGQ